jgi:hypothetical protein
MRAVSLISVISKEVAKRESQHLSYWQRSRLQLVEASNWQVVHCHPIGSQLLEASPEIIVVRVAMSCDATVGARLNVNVEGGPIRAVRHGLAKPKHNPPTKGDLEELQQDDSLYISW